MNSNRKWGTHQPSKQSLIHQSKSTIPCWTRQIPNMPLCTRSKHDMHPDSQMIDPCYPQAQGFEQTKKRKASPTPPIPANPNQQVINSTGSIPSERVTRPRPKCIPQKEGTQLAQSRGVKNVSSLPLCMFLRSHWGLATHSATKKETFPPGDRCWNVCQNARL